VRRRLLFVVLATAGLVVAAFAVPLGALVRNVARDRAVTEAERDVAALAPVLALTTDPGLVAAAIGRTPTGAAGRLTVWLPDGARLGDPTPADPSALAGARDAQRALRREAGGGLELYTPVLTDTGVSVLRARVPAGRLREGLAAAWATLGGIAVVLVAAAGLVADRLARGMTSEAAALARTARALAAGDPDVRAPAGTTPELAEASRALNLLAERIDELRAAERERVADLSHRLRTPLTALRLGAEAAGDERLLADVDRLEAAVTELIQRARRPLHPGAVPAACDLAAVVRERAEHWRPLADDDGRPWRLDCPDGPACRVALAAEEAAAVVDALVGNVFAHTPDGTPYAVSLRIEGATARLAVDDAGPGIVDPEAAVARGVTGRASTGLGLDIARRAAEAAGGRLVIGRSPLGGARVELVLPVRG
jgi:signal transduction histidine kinase